MSSGSFRLISDAGAIKDALDEWHAALRHGSGSPARRSWWDPDLGIGVRLVDRRQPVVTVDTYGADLTTDPALEDFAVQINPGNRPGDGNVPTGIARHSGTGSRWLVRQCWLQRKPYAGGKSERIEAPEFVARTGIVPVPVTVADGPTDRVWAVVCPLDEGSEAARLATAEFVHRVSLARGGATAPRVADGGPGHPDRTRAEELSSGAALGGTFNFAPRPGGVGKRIENDVLNALIAQVDEAGSVWRRPLHYLGYEVDLEVEGAKDLLIELKAEAGAGHVQRGVGQLFLYAELFPRLRAHKKILLLPKAPNADLDAAVAQAGVIRFTFHWPSGESGVGPVRFDQELLDLCRKTL